MADVDFTIMHYGLKLFKKAKASFEEKTEDYRSFSNLVLKFQSISFASCHNFLALRTKYPQGIMVKSTCRHLFCYGELANRFIEFNSVGLLFTTNILERFSPNV